MAGRKNSEKKIMGARIYLRRLKPADASLEYCGWLNDREVNKYLETHQATLADLREFIKKQRANPNSFFAGIFDKKNDRHIGNVKLEPIDWLKREAVFGLLIGNKDYWGRGIATEATRLIVNYAFSDLGLEKIILGVIKENAPAVKVYEKVGFTVEKVDRRHKRANGQTATQLIMSINKEKYGQRL